jgi:mRNA-degrading endonuclease RelE of RelBE toxin-antitoxin system
MPDHYIRRVFLAFEALTQNPAPTPEYDVRKLGGQHNVYRIRIGEIRIEYEVNWESKRIGILAIQFRGRAYK